MMIRSDQQPELLETSSDVIDAVGGTTKAAVLARTTPQCVNNWRRNGRLPTGTFLVFSEELCALGKRAPCALWTMLDSKSVQFAGVN